MQFITFHLAFPKSYRSIEPFSSSLCKKKVLLSAPFCRWQCWGIKESHSKPVAELNTVNWELSYLDPALCYKAAFCLLRCETHKLHARNGQTGRWFAIRLLICTVTAGLSLQVYLSRNKGWVNGSRWSSCKCTLGGILAEQNFEIHSILIFISSAFSTHLSILISNPLTPRFY